MSKILYAILIAALACGCTTNDTDSRKSDTATTSVQPQRKLSEQDLSVHEVPLPAVPDSLSKPSQRADYMMLHFWDGMDFTDDVMVGDTLLVEQTFSNFIELLPHTSTIDALRKSISRMYEQASVNPSAYKFMVEVTEKYLHDPDSPFCNETMYRYFEEAAKSQQKK